ncbi:MAG TPA: DUF192 domain-containing protein [Anaerolineaceae bacterium]|nr:DUF192 domain-containing protein [Anaerolineaceae bacterium]
MQIIAIHNETHPKPRPIQAHHCRSFWCRLRGLMLRSRLEPYEGLLMVEPIESRTNASIHMFFMRFPLCVVWFDRSCRVVGTALALPWRPYYAPPAPAKYILETHPDRIDDFTVGDQLVLQNA